MRARKRAAGGSHHPALSARCRRRHLLPCDVPGVGGDVVSPPRCACGARAVGPPGGGWRAHIGARSCLGRSAPRARAGPALCSCRGSCVVSRRPARVARRRALLVGLRSKSSRHAHREAGIAAATTAAWALLSGGSDGPLPRLDDSSCSCMWRRHSFAPLRILRSRLFFLDFVSSARWLRRPRHRIPYRLPIFVRLRVRRLPRRTHRPSRLARSP